jgi:hypothetical protein
MAVPSDLLRATTRRNDRGNYTKSNCCSAEPVAAFPKQVVRGASVTANYGGVNKTPALMVER